MFKLEIHYALWSKIPKINFFLLEMDEYLLFAEFQST